MPLDGHLKTPKRKRNVDAKNEISPIKLRKNQKKYE
jgi:hypothetical protein